MRQRREEAALGVRRSCMVGVPPILGVLVGALIIGWDTPPEPSAEKAAEAALRAAGMKLAEWVGGKEWHGLPNNRVLYRRAFPRR